MKYTVREETAETQKHISPGVLETWLDEPAGQMSETIVVTSDLNKPETIDLTTINFEATGASIPVDEVSLLIETLQKHVKRMREVTEVGCE